MDGFRLTVLSLVLSLSLACGSANEQPASQPQGNSLTTNAPAPGTPEAPAATPGTEAPGQATNADHHAAAPANAADAKNAPTPPSKPALKTMMEMDVPSGTALHLRLETPVSSETAKVEQTVRATVSEPVVVSGMTVIPEGARVSGTVVAAERAGRVKGRASIAIRFHSVTVANTDYRISTARIVREAEATKGEDAKKIGIGAGAGAAVGAIVGGKKGAAIGAGIGGGAGTGAVLATRGKEVSLPSGASLRTTIQETVKINAPMS
jgi:hypothetical protein